MKRTILIVSLLVALSVSAVVIGTTPPAAVAEAAMRGDRDAVHALLTKGTDVNVPLSDGMTALHYAAALGDAQMAEMLLYAGANPKARTRINDYTPLHLASESGSAAVVKTAAQCFGAGCSERKDNCPARSRRSTPGGRFRQCRYRQYSVGKGCQSERARSGMGSDSPDLCRSQQPVRCHRRTACPRR